MHGSVWMEFKLTACWFKVGSAQVRYLEVVHGRRRARGGPPAVPLVQGVPGLGAQDPGRLLLLEVLDERHGSVGAGQVVATCRDQIYSV